MAKKARLTVFSRFLIMMVVVAPLAFLGASWYNGEDGLQNIKDLFNGNGSSPATETRTSRTDDNAQTLDDKATYELRKLQEELDYKQKRLDEMYKENESLRRQLDQCKTGG